MHWAAAANLGAVLHDQVADHTAAIQAYNKAYTILTSADKRQQQPTDPPEDPNPILSQLQYRIGLCIAHDATKRKCVLEDDPDLTPRDCNELATHAFDLAVKYDPTNEAARHMLATMTADATVKRASNAYVKTLFDDYAGNFEHSLVEELGYTGYERLRRSFDRAFGKGDENDASGATTTTTTKTPVFDLVVDAGCGTGLVSCRIERKLMCGEGLPAFRLSYAQNIPSLVFEIGGRAVSECQQDTDRRRSQRSDYPASHRQETKLVR